VSKKESKEKNEEKAVRDIYGEIRNYLSLISKSIINYEWEEAKNYIKILHSKLISIFLNKGIDTSILNSMFDELINTVDAPYDTIGNNILKRDDCFKTLNEIVNYIGNCGIYIGQQKVIIIDYIESLNEKIKEITKMAHNIGKGELIIDAFIMTCEFIREKIIPHIEVPSELLRYRIIEALDNVISFSPNIPVGQKKFEEALASLRQYVDIVILSNRNPKFKKFFEEHKEEFEMATTEQMENLVKKIVKKILASEGEEG